MSGPIPYARAVTVAAHVANSIDQWCHRIEIAGSIRRKRPVCGDADFVILARDQEAILARIREKCKITTGDSPAAQNTIAVMPDGFQLDFFFARAPSHDLFAPIPGNFGSLLLCRTGSRRHNIQICSRAADMGLHYNPYRGVLRGGTVIASETEEDIYAALNLPWLNPETEREEITVDALQAL
jgi:DNA polymerase (family 10)